MSGRRKSKQRQTKPKALGPPGSLETAEDVIRDIPPREWSLVVELLSRHYQLPDLTSRKGLKECHRNTEVICANLREAFDGTSSVRLKAGIVGIWGKMAYDSLIQDRLLDEGILECITSILEDRDALDIVLPTLATITRHSGSDKMRDVSLAVTPPLISAMKTHIDDPHITQYLITTLAHTMQSSYLDSIQDAVNKNLPDLLSALHSVLCHGDTDNHTFVHAKELMWWLADPAFLQAEGHQHALDFIIGCLRAPDISTRATAIFSLIKIYEEPKVKKTSWDRENFTKHVTAMQNLPNQLQVPISTYGTSSSEKAVYIKSVEDYLAAHDEAAKTQDFCQLGLKLADIIRLSECSIIGGYFQNEDGTRKDGLGLPYDNFVDALPIAAEALRARDPVKYADTIDILLIRFNMMKENYQDAFSMSRTAMERNSEELYWYFVRLSLGNEATAWNLARQSRGFNIPGTSRYLRLRHLELGSLALAVYGLYNLKTERRHLARDEVDLLTPLFALHRALDLAQTYINEAPPDCHNMQEVLAMFICVTLVLKGDQNSPQSRKFKTLRRKIQLAEDYADHFSLPTESSWLKAYKLILERYETATTFWEPRLKAHGISEPDLGDTYIPTVEVDNLYVSMVVDPTRLPIPGFPSSTKCNQSFIDNTVVKLARCTFCGNGSAVMKKCGRCGDARYCNADCQKADWDCHKRLCSSN